MIVRWLERHFYHTQAFLPLGGKLFVVVFEPPSAGELPDPAAVCARASHPDGRAPHQRGDAGAFHREYRRRRGYSEDFEKKDMARRLGI